ncbi:response regulator [Cohnella fermenti]|uniref:Response regulator n=1 Tax=Cohnella fermenti TaxID=2565925 RepID=A0A4S4CBP7_9BACL|nr:response regulator [Cohnella fermenti]THF83316.1 response regulator [Cohnella fermenti]
MIRIMLIDDEEDALDLLGILLEQMDDIEVAGRYLSPVQALEAIGSTPVDAVFLDIQMPGMLGMEAARRIRGALPRIPIIFTTAYAEYAVEAFEIQSTDYLLKPFKPERLYAAVERIRQSLSLYAGQPPDANEGDSPIVQCLGGFHIQAPEGEAGGVAWRTKKEKELCAYLLHQAGKPVGTAEIVEALWPMHDLDKAKSYLYTCLSYLRRTLSEHRIPIAVEKVGQGYVAQAEEAAIDAVVFERLLSGILSGRRLDGRLYERLNLLYQGDYLDGCDYRWATARQLKIKSSYVQALRTGHSQFRSQGNLSLAADSLQRVLALVPESEPDGRELIRLHVDAGNRKEALRVCRQLEEAVRMQLGAELEEMTLALIRQVQGKARRQST